MRAQPEYMAAGHISLALWISLPLAEIRLL
jgi:hypothetical protein